MELRTVEAFDVIDQELSLTRGRRTRLGRAKWRAASQEGRPIRSGSCPEWATRFLDAPAPHRADRPVRWLSLPRSLSEGWTTVPVAKTWLL
jgi:hypothetical protein